MSLFLRIYVFVDDMKLFSLESKLYQTSSILDFFGGQDLGFFSSTLETNLINTSLVLHLKLTLFLIPSVDVIFYHDYDSMIWLQTSWAIPDRCYSDCVLRIVGIHLPGIPHNRTRLELLLAVFISSSYNLIWFSSAEPDLMDCNGTPV